MDKPTKKPAQIANENLLVIDATDLLVGRLATRVARESMHGKTVRVLNCEKAIMSGSKAFLVPEWKRRNRMGVPRKGPYIHRFPDRMVRRIIRGMLAHHNPRGREAFARIMCYIGVPTEFKEMNPITFEEMKASKLPNTRFMTIAALCKELGGKWHEQ